MSFTEDEDLDYWLQTQALPKEEAPQPGAWQRAEQLLKSQQRPADPMPLRNGKGMDWATALAAIAGKDPGGVIAADAANRRADLRAWHERNGPDAQFARQRALAGTLIQEDAAKRAVSEDDVRRGNLDARNRELDLAERQLGARLGRENGTSTPWAEAQRLVTGAPPPSPDDVRAARAGDFESPTGPTADPKPKRGAAPAAAASGDLLLIPGTEVVDDAVARRTMGDTVTRRGLEKDLAVLFDAERSLRRMKEIRESAGIEPGKSADKSEYNRLRSAVVAAESKLSSQGVVSPTEFKLHVKDIPGLEYSDDIIGNTGKLAGELVGKDYDPTRDALSGTHKAIVDAINAGLSVRGLRMAGEPKPPPAAAAAGEQPPPAGDTLPTTTGKAPPLPADATQGADVKTPRNVIKPNGSRVVYPLSDDEYRRLMAKPGWGSF
jgi:hypothetical protein